MPNTYTLIEKITVGAAGASSITFTSIPQTYTDLIVKISGRSTTTDVDMFFTFNSNTSNYTRRVLRGTGSNASSTNANDNYATTIDGSGETSNTFANLEMYIPNYTSSNNKSYSIDDAFENNSTTAYQYMLAGLWSNSSAITSLTFYFLSGGTFAQYSTAYLYGIAKEGVSPSPSSAPYATGGDSIVFDGTYWIHTFRSSGTFTPKKALTCDYLVVAGGGSGSSPGGGGGAGGFRTNTSQSFTNGTAYTITIGAGGAAPSNARGNSGTNSSIAGTGMTTFAATGGGGGGRDGTNPPLTGGSGGGGGRDGNSTGAAGNAGSYSPSEGNSGGTSQVNGFVGGAGGGGAGGAGLGGTGNNISTNEVAGAGGAGSSSSLSGTSVTYAGGGGGGNENYLNFGGNGGAGGSGGGGTGGKGSITNGVAGTANTGGGGGGAGRSTDTGGAGGSGIVIVRYAA